MSAKQGKIILGVAYGFLLAGLTAYTVMETFLLPSASGTLDPAASSDLFDFDDSSSEAAHASSAEEPSSGALPTSSEEIPSSAEKTTTTISYEEKTAAISGKTVPYLLVSVNLKRISDLRTKVATDGAAAYGTNITSSFSDLISAAQSESQSEVLFAIDGDFPFWSGRKGYVIRNGVSYRQAKRSDSANLDLAIFKDGTFQAYDESSMNFSTVLQQHNGCYQNWSFGPALLVDSTIAVDEDQDVSQTKSANQRVAMGYQDDGTLYFLCSNTDDGKRSGSSVGLSLFDMAGIFQDLGCSLAYNFDGGGSAGLYVKGYGSDGYYQKPSRNLGDIVYVVDAQ